MICYNFSSFQRQRFGLPHFSSVSKAAGYLGKYIGKDMVSDRILGQRRYYVSEQIERPVEYMELKAPNDIDAIAEVKGAGRRTLRGCIQSRVDR